jgi:hypothetical protein
MSDGDAALTNTHTARVHAIARAAFCSSLRQFSRANVGIRVAHLVCGDIVVIAVLVIVGAGRASAQEVTPGPGTIEITLIPGGATFYTSTDTAPEFGNYTFGAGVTYAINRILGVEGEVAGTVGISQELAFGGATTSQKSPDTLNYSANLVVSASTHTSFVPYVTGGVGGLTMFERASLGIRDTGTFLTGNVGGGVKWYASNGRWGLRGDYRFTAVRDKGDAPSFFGRDTRYGHRAYGGLIIDVVR